MLTALTLAAMLAVPVPMPKPLDGWTSGPAFEALRCPSLTVAQLAERAPGIVGRGVPSGMVLGLASLYAAREGRPLVVQPDSALLLDGGPRVETVVLIFGRRGCALGVLQLPREAWRRAERRAFGLAV